MSTPEPVPPSVPPADQMPPGFSPNGHPGPMTAAVQQVTAALQQLPQMLFQAAAAALAQQQVTVKHLYCATCLTERLKWASAHTAEMRAADVAWRAAVAEMEARAPEDRVPVDPAAFIPPHLQAGPQISEGAVMIGGTVYCPQHVPGVAGQQGAGQLLVAQAHITPALLAQMRGNAA